MVKNKFVLLIFSIFLISLVSANGLVISPSSLEVNKTIGVDKFVEFTITNEEPIDFKNVVFESNPYISINSINISSGGNVSVEAEIIATQDFSGVVNLKGFYESNLGQQQETHNINVDYANGLSLCDFSIVEGDTVVWNNSVPSSIKMINADTGGEVTTISESSSFTRLFDETTSFSYYFTRFGVRFTNTCTITSLGTSGLINNPEYDANLALDIKITYEPTELEITILSDQYEVAPGRTQQDLLSVRNIGGNVAKGVKLEGDWFLFSSNNFDLEPGQSRNVGYTISPIVNSTNQTNQSYEKTIKITGNFDTYTKDFQIFLPYTVINEDFFKDSKTLAELFEERFEFVQAYCLENPNNELCSRLRSGEFGTQQNETDSDLEFKKAIIEEMDKDAEFRKYVLDKFVNFENQLNQTTNNSIITLNKVDSTEGKVNTYQTGVNFAAGMFLLLLLGTGGTVLFKKYKKNKQKEKFENYY